MASQDQLAKASTYVDAKRAAGTALLNSITEAVKAVDEMGGGTDNKVPRLKVLAEAYALVAHGKE